VGKDLTVLIDHYDGCTRDAGLLIGAGIVNYVLQIGCGLGVERHGDLGCGDMTDEMQVTLIAAKWSDLAGGTMDII
jgi:hypothetical protein